jgi:dTDP-4-dehydrorhamnose reductase
MNRLLIIGNSGLVGSRLAELARGRYEVFGTYNTHELKQRNMTRLDVTNREATFKLIGNTKPDFVIDTHSLNNVDYCEAHQEESWRINVDGSRNVAEACRNFGCKYVFISTDSVFDGRKLRYTEKDKPHPLNYLSKNKVIVEQMLSTLDVNYIVARPSVIYGKGGMNKISFALWLIEKLRKGEKVRIVSDQYNNPTFADNLAEQLLALCEKDEQGVFNTVGRDCISRLDFSKEIARAFGLNEKLITSVITPELNQIAVRPGRINLAVDKVERATGIKMLTVSDGLTRLKEQLEGGK